MVPSSANEMQLFKQAVKEILLLFELEEENEWIMEIEDGNEDPIIPLLILHPPELQLRSKTGLTNTPISSTRSI